MAYIVVGGRDMTPYISHDVDIQASVSDPLPKCSFTLDDINANITLNPLDPVIVWDENAIGSYAEYQNGALYSVPAVPSINIQISTAYQAQGTLSPLSNYMTIGNGYIDLNFYNAPAGTAYGQQTTLAGYITPGVEYMFSCYLTLTPPILNLLAFLQIVWLDQSYNTLGTTYGSWSSEPYPNYQVNISGVAPAGAAFAYLQIGAQTTVGGNNSGAIQWTSPQFEPMWFVAEGITYPTPDNNFAQVASVQMPDGTISRKARIFTGYIDDLQIRYEGNQRYYTVDCAGTTKVLEMTNLLSISYSNQYDDQIITDIITNHYSGILSIGQMNSSAPLSTIVRGSLIDQITFTDNTLREISNTLSDNSGQIFYVDPYFYYHYVPSYFDITTTQLSDNPDFATSFPYLDYSIEYDATQLANRIKVTGNKQNATAVDDTFSGDGTTTIFNLTSPPFTVQSVTVNGTKQKTGVYGVDTFTTGRYSYTALVNKQQQYVLFKTAPSAGSNNIVVEYTYEDAVVAQVMSPDSYAKYKQWFDRKVNDSNLTSTTAAKNRGLAELTKYAFARTILTFSTDNIYIPVGSIVLFSSRHDNLSQQPFTVQTVETTHRGGGVYEYKYTAGAYNPTLIDHMRNIHKSINRTTTTANVPVIVTYDLALFDVVTYGETLTVTAGPTNPTYVYSDINASYLYVVKADSPAWLLRLGEAVGTTAYDASGNGDNGTYSSSGITYSEQGPLIGDVTKAVLLVDANNNVGYVTCSSSFNPAGLSTFSVEAWVKLQTVGFTTQPTVVANAIPQSSLGGFSLWIDTAGAGAHFVIGNNTTYGDAHVVQQLAANTWYYLTGTYDGTTVKLYVNGSLVASAGLSGTIAGVGSVPVIGHNPAGSGDYLPGTVADCAVYSSTLSATRVSAHYTAAA